MSGRIVLPKLCYNCNPPQALKEEGGVSSRKLERATGECPKSHQGCNFLVRNLKGHVGDESPITAPYRPETWRRKSCIVEPPEATASEDSTGYAHPCREALETKNFPQESWGKTSMTPPLTQ